MLDRRRVRHVGFAAAPAPGTFVFTRSVDSFFIVVIMTVASLKPSFELITRGAASGGNGVTAEIERLALEALTRGVREKRRLQDIRDDIFYPVRRYVRKATVLIGPGRAHA